MKFSWNLLFKALMAALSVFLGATQYVEHQEHKQLQAQIQNHLGG